MENRIKEQRCLIADRVSAETMRAHQLRLYLSAMAYVLVSGLRGLGLKMTELAGVDDWYQAAEDWVRVTVCKVGVSMASSYPWQPLDRQAWANPRC
jgi:hypothetical protein